jgi:hypothetical protein
MASDNRKDLLILVALGGAAALVIAWLVLRAPRGSRAAIEAVPADSFLVASADAWAIAESPIGAAFLGDGGTRGTAVFGLGSVASTCGYNPLMHLRTLALAVPEKGERGDFGVAATGDLGREEIERCARAMIESRGGKPSVRTSGTFTVVSDSAASHGGSIAFRDGGPYLVGRGAWLDRMIDVAEGRAPGIASAPGHEVMRTDLKKRDLDAEALIVTAVLPSELRTRIKDEMMLESPDGGAMDPKMEGVLGVSTAGLAVHAGRGPNDELRLVAELRCGSDDGCAKVETLILHQRLKWSGELALRLGGLGPLIDNVETLRPEPGVLVVRTHAPGADLAGLVDRFTKPAAPRGPGSSAPPLQPDAVIGAVPDSGARDAR